jgi:hypothetical protein
VSYGFSTPYDMALNLPVFILNSCSCLVVEYMCNVYKLGGRKQNISSLLKGLSHQFESGYKWYGWKEEK